MSILMPMKYLVACMKIGLLYLLNRRIGPAEYGSAYDRVSSTYDRWTERMGIHTDRILDPDLLPRTGGTFRVLDLACGTGYITGKLLETLPLRCPAGFRITAVDLSGGMLGKCRSRFHDPNVEFVNAEAEAYLGSVPEGSFDAIFCGWGLVYLNSTRVIPLLHRALAEHGIFCGIMNRRGSLAGIERIFIELMLDMPDGIRKIMDIRFGMPRDERAFSRRFTRRRFETVLTGSGDELQVLDHPDGLYEWLVETGAIAGTDAIFSDSRTIREKAIEKIAGRLRKNGGFAVNHSFVFGIFRKRSR